MSFNGLQKRAKETKSVLGNNLYYFSSKMPTDVDISEEKSTTNYQAMPKVNEKTGKINKKKKFGKSIGKRASAMLLSMIDRKLSYYDKNIIKVDTWEVSGRYCQIFYAERN